VKDDIVYLKHILECIRRIEENTRDRREIFLASHTLQDAVLRNLQTLSESTQRLSEGSRAKHPELEWKRIAAFRNILVHGYLGIDMERVWEIVQRDVPALKRAALALLSPTEEKP
jgi:uncharacterized protein with HEPN domain